MTGGFFEFQKSLRSDDGGGLAEKIHIDEAAPQDWLMFVQGLCGGLFLGFCVISGLRRSRLLETRCWCAPHESLIRYIAKKDFQSSHMQENKTFVL